MILVLGARLDDHADGMQAELEARGAEVVRLDPYLLASLTIRDGFILVPGRKLAVADVRAVCVGRSGRASQSHVLQHLWADCGVPVLPAAPDSLSRAAGESFQREVAESLGFECEFSEFGLAELAVTIAGDRVFASSVVSSVEPWHRIDWWRFNQHGETINSVDLPTGDAQRCRSLVAMLGLKYAVITFSHSETGELVFLGVDPYRHFGWIEEATGSPATAAVVDEVLAMVAAPVLKQRAVPALRLVPQLAIATS